MEENVLHYYTGKSIEAQYRYCEKHKVPVYAPTNGLCLNCHNPIYIIGGISVEEAESMHITGCPYCHVSFKERGQTWI